MLSVLLWAGLFSTKLQDTLSLSRLRVVYVAQLCVGLKKTDKQVNLLLCSVAKEAGVDHDSKTQAEAKGEPKDPLREHVACYGQACLSFSFMSHD